MVRFYRGACNRAQKSQKRRQKSSDIVKRHPRERRQYGLEAHHRPTATAESTLARDRLDFKNSVYHFGEVGTILFSLVAIYRGHTRICEFPWPGLVVPSALGDLWLQGGEMCSRWQGFEALDERVIESQLVNSDVAGEAMPPIKPR